MNLVDTKTIIFRAVFFQIPKSCSWVAANPDGMVYAYKSEPVWSDTNECWSDIGDEDEAREWRAVCVLREATF